MFHLSGKIECIYWIGMPPLSVQSKQGHNSEIMEGT